MTRKIRIKSGKASAFNTNFVVKGINYHVQTEEGSEKYPFITSTAYMGGIIVDKMKSPFSFGDGVKKDELNEIMTKHHKFMIEKMKRKHLESSKSKTDYIKEARKLIKRKKLKNALELLEDAIALFPDDPFVLSLHGYLRAAVLKQYREGKDECKTALSMYDKKQLVEGEYYLHFFYLNLGKVFLLTGHRDISIQYFRKGLDQDKGNSDIIHELIQLGVRKKPVLPFLSRGSFLNRFFGKMLSGFRQG